MARPKLDPIRSMRFEFRMTEDILSEECEVSKADIMTKALYNIFRKFPASDQEIMLKKLQERKHEKYVRSFN